MAFESELQTKRPLRHRSIVATMQTTGTVTASMADLEHPAVTSRCVLAARAEEAAKRRRGGAAYCELAHVGLQAILFCVAQFGRFTPAAAPAQDDRVRLQGSGACHFATVFEFVTLLLPSSCATLRCRRARSSVSPSLYSG